MGACPPLHDDRDHLPGAENIRFIPILLPFLLARMLSPEALAARRRANEYMLDMANLHVERSIRQACTLAKNRHRAQEKRMAAFAETEKKLVNTVATLNVEDLRMIFSNVNGLEVHVYGGPGRTVPNPFRHLPAHKSRHFKHIAKVRKSMKAIDKENDKLEKYRQTQASKRERALAKKRINNLFEEIESSEL